jgi:hypothetical protein
LVFSPFPGGRASRTRRGDGAGGMGEFPGPHLDGVVPGARSAPQTLHLPFNNSQPFPDVGVE